MDLSTALKLFTTLEKETYGWVDDLDNVGHTAPLYKVRLDASIAGAEVDMERRYYTLFVTVDAEAPGPTDAWQFVTEQAVEHGVEFEPENNGLRLT